MQRTIGDSRPRAMILHIIGTFTSKPGIWCHRKNGNMLTKRRFVRTRVSERKSESKLGWGDDQPSVPDIFVRLCISRTIESILI
jgi:hypothetical protein